MSLGHYTTIEKPAYMRNIRVRKRCSTYIFFLEVFQLIMIVFKLKTFIHRVKEKP